MSFTFTMPAADGERFAPDAFANQIGHRTTVRAGDQTREAIVLRAEVAVDGRTAEVTVDADLSEFVPLPPSQPGDFSFAREPW